MRLRHIVRLSRRIIRKVLPSRISSKLCRNKLMTPEQVSRKQSKPRSLRNSYDNCHSNNSHATKNKRSTCRTKRKKQKIVWLSCSDYTIRIAPSAARCGRRQQNLAATPLSHFCQSRINILRAPVSASSAVPTGLPSCVFSKRIIHPPSKLNYAPYSSTLITHPAFFLSWGHAKTHK
jgi:hypothetical protein